MHTTIWVKKLWGEPNMSIDRLQEENDRPYLAYTCYRDLGLARSIVARDTLYDAYGLWAIVRELEGGGQSKRITLNSP
jgi:hypothetical protein